jgi:hypothetical protein
MKKTFTIKRGQHKSKGPKLQPIIFPLALIVAGLLMNLSNELTFWLSALCYAASVIVYIVLYYRLLLTIILVKFDKSCLYDLGDDPDQFDVNKLFGVSLGHHHSNSARFGWRAAGDKIELFYYVYSNKERIHKKIMTCDVGKSVELTIDIKRDHYEFIAKKENGQKSKHIVERPKPVFSNLFIYKLFPYFGGNEKAPHDMRIDMTDIE